MDCPAGCGPMIPGNAHDHEDGFGGEFIVHNLSCPKCERFVLDYELVHREEETPELRPSEPANESDPGRPGLPGSERGTEHPRNQGTQA